MDTEWDQDNTTYPITTMEILAKNIIQREENMNENPNTMNEMPCLDMHREH